MTDEQVVAIMAAILANPYTTYEWDDDRERYDPVTCYPTADEAAEEAQYLFGAVRLERQRQFNAENVS